MWEFQKVRSRMPYRWLQYRPHQITCRGGRCFFYSRRKSRKQNVEAQEKLEWAVSSSKCNELMMLKKVKQVRHKQFCRALPAEALVRTRVQ